MICKQACVPFAEKHWNMQITFVHTFPCHWAYQLCHCHYCRRLIQCYIYLQYSNQVLRNQLLTVFESTIYVTYCCVSCMLVSVGDTQIPYTSWIVTRIRKCIRVMYGTSLWINSLPSLIRWKHPNYLFIHTLYQGSCMSYAFRTYDTETTFNTCNHSQICTETACNVFYLIWK